MIKVKKTKTVISAQIHVTSEEKIEENRFDNKSNLHYFKFVLKYICMRKNIKLRHQQNFRLI